MRKNLTPKAYIYPLPVLIIGTYDQKGNPNAMNAAWGTVCDNKKVSICIDKTHKTLENILKNKAFTVAFADVSNVVPADFVGIVSANNNPEKFKQTGWNVQKGEFVNAPVIVELPLCLECTLESYNEQTEICIGEVVNVSANESILDASGKIDLTKFKPICYDCGTHGYYQLGARVGNAFSDGKKLK